MIWCCKNKPKKLDNEFTDEMEAIPTLTPTADELQQDYMIVFNPENRMGDVLETSKDTVMASESDKELLSESVTREMKSKANHDLRKKKTYTADAHETAASDMWVKLFAHVTDQIRAAEKRMTASFTRQFNILHEEVRTLRNESDTQLPKCTSVYDDHHDWGNLSDGTFPNHDSTKATADTYPAPKAKHMESTTQGDVNHTKAGLRGGVLDECFSPNPNIEIKNADLSVESIEKKQFQLTSQERKRKRKPSTKLRTPYTCPRPFYSRASLQINHTLSLKEFVKPGPKIFRDVGLPEKQSQNWFRRMKSVRSDLDDTHIDCFARLLKRKIEAAPKLFKSRIGILPTYFFVSVKSDIQLLLSEIVSVDRLTMCHPLHAQSEVIWKRDYVKTEKTFVEEEWICPDDLTSFVRGGQLTWCKAWWDYDIILIPCCVCSSHWVLCELNLYTYKIEIYDSLHEGNDKKKQLKRVPHIQSLISFLPGILRAAGYYEQRKSDPKPLEVDVVEPYLIPQQHDTRSCGVFIMKYMENIVQDKCYQMDFTSDDMKAIRSEIAEWFFQASKPC